MSKVSRIDALEVDLVDDYSIHYIVVAEIEDARHGRSDLCHPADIAEPGYMLPGICSATFQIDKTDPQPNLDLIDLNLDYIESLNLSWELDNDEF